MVYQSASTSSFVLLTPPTGLTYTYVATFSNGTALPSFISFTTSSSTGSFTYSTIKLSDIGVYSFRVTATLNNAQKTNTYTDWYLFIVNPKYTVYAPYFDISTAPYQLKNQKVAIGNTLLYTLPTKLSLDGNAVVGNFTSN